MLLFNSILKAEIRVCMTNLRAPENQAGLLDFERKTAECV